MNILVVYPYIPFPLDRGTYQRTFHLLRELAREHTVDLIALSEEGERLEQRPVFEEFCREVRFVSFQHPKWPKLLTGRLFKALPSTIRHWSLPQMAQAIREQLKTNHYDLVHVCDIVMAQYFLKEHRDIPLSIDRSRVDLQFQQQQTTHHTRSWKDKCLAYENMVKLWFYERRVAKRSQLQVLCGPDDEVFVRQWISRKAPLKVVANGVDLDFFKPNLIPAPRAAKPTILFCGAMDYTPNVDALRWYFSEIHDGVRAQVPDLEVLIVGKTPVAEVQAYAEKSGVTVTGSVPDVRPYYQRAWLQIVPLRIGGGTRLKIVESLSIGTPVVSTTIGAQGLNLDHDSQILLADKAADFIHETVRALATPPLREKLREAGIRTAQRRFSWSQIGADLAKAYTELVPAQPERIHLMDIPFDRVTMAQTLDRVGNMITSRQPHCIATANVDFLVQAKGDGDLRQILHEAHLVVCDGTPLVWLSRLLKKALPERVAGSDLVPQLLRQAEQKGWSVYFLGGQEAVLKTAIQNVQAKHPALRIAGSESPPFRPLAQMDHEGICARIREAKPDILLVSFGCPKQEKWIRQNYEAAGVPVNIGVGATIDFLAGAMKRAPRWMQVCGLEWVFRLCQEPRRLIKRYALDLVVFGIGACRELLHNRRPAHV
ncbi:polymer biosynthesis protein, WecB/TagA/CpsF family [Prosthecobacter debontii]|uniref:Polymer biosynthesis protein, WecB/TagA/CpsF family n=1 Tax=Prosthecobacter debontii TaxID=48467 RepID=A0A1T4XVQ3_9BACT|nr:WecB/TagA/CpsF family glycosyltransferase [Prosthecobacter debontii]SKA93131.1 polymer biosynthesis protein, WecB/TagA/CpsF family [Prosthecobacter debontii]